MIRMAPLMNHQKYNMVPLIFMSPNINNSYRFMILGGTIFFLGVIFQIFHYSVSRIQNKTYTGKVDDWLYQINQNRPKKIRIFGSLNRDCY
jgi:hypothetical protein